MIWIALAIAFCGWLLFVTIRNIVSNRISKIEKEKEDCIRKYNDLSKALQAEKEAVASQRERIEKEKDYYERCLKSFDKVIERKAKNYKYLAPIVADLMTLYCEKSAQYLEHKNHPAILEAKRIRDIRADLKAEMAGRKEAEYKLKYILEFFPNVEDIFDDGFNEEIGLQLETDDDTDRVRSYLSHEEYANLSETDRNQLALDRYVANRKSKWQVGRDYEMYIGYLYRKDGFSVLQTGILDNIEDMGRDLICRKNDLIYIVQCKNWSKEKEIHEKHIFQLFGTVVLFNIEPSMFKAKGVFCSTTKLSKKAEKIAKELGIDVSYIPPGDFPRIKCNINKSTKEKIYHLPFDQQYDSAKIDESIGEFYAFTVKEAEENGFRRAKRHFS